MNDQRKGRPDKALWIWDNRARSSLPPALYIWLAILVGTVLFSAVFVAEHLAARFLLAGFVTSHAVVFGLGGLTKFTIRRGFVSLSHVVCWAPGLCAVTLDFLSGTQDEAYRLWLVAATVVIAISLAFDLRDSFVYLRQLKTGFPVVQEGACAEPHQE